MFIYIYIICVDLYIYIYVYIWNQRRVSKISRRFCLGHQHFLPTWWLLRCGWGGGNMCKTCIFGADHLMPFPVPIGPQTRPIHTSQAPCLQIPQVPCSKSNFLRTARVPKNWKAKWETWSAKIFVPKRSCGNHESSFGNHHHVLVPWHTTCHIYIICHHIDYLMQPNNIIYSMGFFVAIFCNEFVFLAYWPFRIVWVF